MKKIIITFIIGSILLSFSGVIFADSTVGIKGASLGESSTVYRLLAPLSINGKGINCIDTNTEHPDANCASGGIGDYLNIIFKLSIGLCAVLAVIMIVIGGIQWMGEDSVFGKVEAKSKIGSAVLGLLIALGAYALLNTINPDLLGKDGVSIDQASIVLDPDTPQAIPKSGEVYQGTNYKTGDDWPSDQKDRATLQQLGINVNSSVCKKVGDSACTSVLQLDNSFVVKLKNGCGSTPCDIMITEGTAFWKHALNTKKIHYPGGWTVDLRKTTSLSSYVHTLNKKRFDTWYKGQGADCYYNSNGLGIVEEGDHFHAFSLTGGCDINKQGL